MMRFSPALLIVWSLLVTPAFGSQDGATIQEPIEESNADEQKQVPPDLAFGAFKEGTI